MTAGCELIAGGEMKKMAFITFVMLVLFSALIPAFPFGGRAESGQAEACGHLTYFGNAPFAFPGFQTEDGLLYGLEVAEDADFTLKDIEKAQGSLLEIRGEIRTGEKNGLWSLKNGVFVVHEWKKL